MNSKHGVGNYVAVVEPDDVPNPTGLAPQQYAYTGYPANMLAPPPGAISMRTGPYTFAPSQGTGPYGAVAAPDDDKMLKFILWGVAALAVYLLFIRPAIKRNPPRKRSSVARIVGSDSGGFYWKLLRKNARRHGPYATKGDARQAAQCKGHKVLSR